MIILSFAKYTDTEQIAALASGMAVDWRKDDELPLRLIKNGPDAFRAEMEILGDRIFRALEYQVWPIDEEDRDAPSIPISPAVTQQQER